jgi:5,5'-dehydrodivanillate O-demethylase
MGDDIPAGRAKPLRILGEDLTVYRGESGSPHVVAFRCAHRGTQLSTGWVDGDDIRCFYHGWKYAPDGRCVEQPAEPEPFCNRIAIKSYPVREYLGMVFVYLGEGEPPPMWRFPGFEQADDGVLEVHTYIWPCSYINSLENDPVHVLFVHRDSARAAAGKIEYPTIECVETDGGFDMTQTFPSGRSTVTHHYMPNVGHNRGRTLVGWKGWREALFWRVPVDDLHFASFSAALTHLPDAAERARYVAEEQHLEERRKQQADIRDLSEEVLRGALRIEDIPDLADDQSRLFNVQDYVTQVGQGQTLDLEHEHLGRTDATVVMARNIWARELRALAKGHPTKRWVYPSAD